LSVSTYGSRLTGIWLPFPRYRRTASGLLFCGFLSCSILCYPLCLKVDQVKVGSHWSSKHVPNKAFETSLGSPIRRWRSSVASIGGQVTAISRALRKTVRPHSLSGARCHSSCSVWLQLVCCLDQEIVSCSPFRRALSVGCQ
jgi:hypothetical protein